MIDARRAVSELRAIPIGIGFQLGRGGCRAPGSARPITIIDQRLELATNRLSTVKLSLNT